MIETIKKPFYAFSLFLSLAGLLIPFSSSSFAQSDEDRKFLLMYFKDEELTVESPTRSRKSVTRVAENITVVTADDIKLMNAHSVADVLNTITGVQVLRTGAPGSVESVALQGSENRHVAVFMDGIPLNDLSDNATDVGSLPVQNIEKIEIIKGPASSAWGSSLGGVINIITKSGGEEDTHGMASASYGKRNTGDFRAETSGKESRFGYYVNAGRLQTDGFRPHNDFSGNNAYIKLTYELTNDTRLFLTTGYIKLKRGVFENLDGLPPFLPPYFENNDMEVVRSSVGVNSSINEDTMLNISAWHLRQTLDFSIFDLNSSQEIDGLQQDLTDKGYGASAKLTWKQGSQNVVLGAESDSRKLKSNAISGGEQKLTKVAFFINDTVSFGPLAVIPGVRQDHTNSNGDFTSPSFGMTYKLADSTLLRAYAARGFNIPPLAATNASPGLRMEKVWSYEAGAETTALKYLWLKLSGFRHEIRDAIARDPATGQTVNRAKQRRQGMEAEIKTMPFYHLTLSSGAAFINTKDLDTGETVPNVPQRTYDLGLQYDDEKSLKALLNGHAIYWNTAPSSTPSLQGKYNSFIFDLHLTKNIYASDKQALELFGDIHNIFNGSQYAVAIYRNPERWFEAGIRYMF